MAHVKFAKRQIINMALAKSGVVGGRHQIKWVAALAVWVKLWPDLWPALFGAIRVMKRENLQQNSKLGGLDFDANHNNTNPDPASAPQKAESDSNRADCQRIWRNLSARIRAVFGSGDFKAWIEPLLLDRADEKYVFFAAPNGFAKSRVRTEYLHRLQAIWNDFDNLKRRIIIDVAKQVERQSSIAKDAILEFKLTDSADIIGHNNAPPPKNHGANELAKDELINEPIDFALSPRRFDNFEEGASNKIAIAVAKRIATEAKFGELLYIHGYNGVGKTHLMSAIGNLSIKTDPMRRVVSLNAQRFLHLFQTALRERDSVAFKEGLRKADLLLIDDIQFICGKSATQLEFFQTISDLLARGKSVVCTGDVPADALAGLDNRMKGILLGGFNVRIDEPDFDLRRKIAIRKAAEFAIKRPDFAPPVQAFDILAARVIGTGRAIEGAVKQIFASSALIGQEATMEVVLEAIGDRFGLPTKSVPVETIKKRVAAHFEISIEDLIGSRRHIAVARPRQIAMYFCKKFTKRSYPDIAARMGGRDHTTVMHAVKRIEELMNKDPNFAASMQILANKLLS